MFLVYTIFSCSIIKIYAYRSVPCAQRRRWDGVVVPVVESVSSILLSWSSGAAWSSWWIGGIGSAVVRLSWTVRGVAWSVDWRLPHRGPVAWAHSAWDAWLVSRGRSTRSWQVVGQLVVRRVGCASSCAGIGTDTACSRWALVARAAARVGWCSSSNSSVRRT